MVQVLILILLALYLTGNISVNIPGLGYLKMVLFSINGHAITLLNLLIFIVVVSAAESLKSPFREIAAILVILWVLSVFGIISIVWSANFIVVGIIALLLFSLIVHD